MKGVFCNDMGKMIWYFKRRAVAAIRFETPRISDVGRLWRLSCEFVSVVRCCFWDRKVNGYRVFFWVNKLVWVAVLSCRRRKAEWTSRAWRPMQQHPRNGHVGVVVIWGLLWLCFGELGLVNAFCGETTAAPGIRFDEFDVAIDWNNCCGDVCKDQFIRSCIMLTGFTVNYLEY